MTRILNIDTAVASASVCLAVDGAPIASKINPEPRDGAAWLHPAIQDLLQEQRTSLHQLDALAISAGPGSYTGLRVGMAAAKGLCYALQKPLIAINTLEMMAAAADHPDDAWLCPMIDARRMEVFTALYDASLQEIMPPSNLILDADSFRSFLDQHQIIFFGNGSEKLREVVHHGHAYFKNVEATAEHMSRLSFSAFQMGKFADLAYSEPFYGKDFYAPAVKPII